MTENPSHIMSVSAVTELIKELIETAIPPLSVEGEISNFRPSSTGHWYFTVKDARASLSAVMFRNRIRFAGSVPKNGDKVRLRGSLSVYAPRGSYQLICESIEAVGTGDILAQLEERKRRLQSEGLFDQQNKAVIPPYPQSIAVITSPTGAALRDILQVLRRRNAGIRVSILPAAVQGEQAASQLTAMIELANRYQVGDVIIIGRGGGSIEDLLPFSDELLVRAVAASGIPVISAVGHETDWALIDHAADRRAPTPSAAAELVTSEMQAARDAVTAHREQITHQMRGAIRTSRLQLGQYAPGTLADAFRHRCVEHHMRIGDASEQILHSMQMHLQKKRHAAESASRELQSSSPQQLMSRGFAMLFHASTGKRITSIDDIEQGEKMESLLTDGILASEVYRKEHN